MTGPINRSGWSHRGNGSGSPNRPPAEPDVVGEVEPDAAMASSTTRRVGRNGRDQLRRRQVPGGRVARRRRRRPWSATAGSCISITVGCSSRPMPAVIDPTSRPRACNARRGRVDAGEPAVRVRGVGNAQGRLLRQRVLRRLRATGPATDTSVAKCKSRLSVTRSRSRSARTHPPPSDPSRPHPRTRRARQPRRPTPTHQRRITRPRLSGRYRNRTVRRVPTLLHFGRDLPMIPSWRADPPPQRQFVRVRVSASGWIPTPPAAYRSMTGSRAEPRRGRTRLESLPRWSARLALR